jgi:predicted transcriptional regulator
VASTDWNAYGFVIASEYRKKVILALAERPRTPKDIARITGLYLSHVSNTLTELREKKLVELLSPTLRRGKIFGITDRGQQVVDLVTTA